MTGTDLHQVWMRTYTGRQFYPFNAKENLDGICIRDIAHALSMQCRFGGHTRRFYSVAEHSVHLARYVLKQADLPASMRSQPRRLILEWAMWALLHDGSEAYIADIVRPVKHALPGYAVIENNIMDAIAYKFKLTDVLPQYIIELDNRILIDERAQAMRANINSAYTGGETEPLGITVEFWHPDTAENKFLGCYYNILEEMLR